MEIMSLDQPHDICVAIPKSAFTVEGFQSFMESEDFPEYGRIEFCDGEVLVDMSPERIESHALAKGEVYRVLANLVKERDLGVMLPDGAAFTNDAADIVTQPDGMFVSFDARRTGRVRGGTPDDTPLGYRGAVDWILEVISPSSVAKDRQRWVQKYAEAGVREYWIVDARKKDIELDIHVLTDSGYRIQTPVDGWYPSPTFGLEFRMEESIDSVGGRQFTLRTR